MSHCLDNSEGQSFARNTDSSSLRSVASQTYCHDSQDVFRFPFSDSSTTSSLPGLHIGDCDHHNGSSSSDTQTVNLSATDRNLLQTLDTDIQNLTHTLEHNSDNTCGGGNNTGSPADNSAWSPFEQLTSGWPQQHPHDGGLMNELTSLDNSIGALIRLLEQQLFGTGDNQGGNGYQQGGNDAFNPLAGLLNPGGFGGQQPLIEINIFNNGDQSQGGSSGSGSSGFPFPMPFQNGSGSGSGSGGFPFPPLPNPSDLIGGLPQPPNPFDLFNSLPKPPNPGDLLGSLPKPPIPLPGLGGGDGGGFPLPLPPLPLPGLGGGDKGGNPLKHILDPFHIF